MMSATLDTPAPLSADDVLDALIRTATGIGDWLATHDTADDRTQHEVSTLVRRLHTDTPAQAFAGDPALSNAVYAGSARAMVALQDGDARRARRELRLAVEQIRQALRDIREVTVDDTRPAADVLAWLLDTLSVSQPVLAELLDTSPRTLSRWLADTAEPTGDSLLRLRRLAAVTQQLRHVLTGPGVAQWLTSGHPTMKDAPIGLLDDAVGYRTVLSRATGLRAIQAT